MNHSNKIRILAVDDTQDNLDLICEVFAEPPYEIVTAQNAEQALKLARSERMDLAIVDVQMPDVDGYELCRRLRALPDAQRLPVIFLTAENTSTNYAVQGLDLGARDYITKPFDATELRARVRAVLRADREHEEKQSAFKASAAELQGKVQNLETANLAMEAAATKNEGLVAELQDALRQASNDPETHGRILPVFGAKGGVGQSVIAVNLALAIHEVTEARVVLLDGNMPSGDVGALLDIYPKYSLGDLLPHADALDAELLGAVLGRHSSGIEVIVAPSHIELNDAAEAAPLKKILLTLRDRFDYVVVDCAPLTARCAQSTLETADSVLLVTTAEVTAIRRAQSFLQEIRSVLAEPGLLFGVLNRYERKDDVTTHEIEEALRIEFAAVIPNDPAVVTTSVNKGVPYVLSRRKSKVSKCVLALARSIVEKMDQTVSGSTATSSVASNG